MFLAILVSMVCTTAAWSGETCASSVRVLSFLPGEPLCRAQRTASVVAVLENTTDAPLGAEATLVLPDGVRGSELGKTVVSGDSERVELRWEIVAIEAKAYTLRLDVAIKDAATVTADLSITFLPAMAQRKLDYIPEPEAVKTDILVGAHNCPLWETDKPKMWDQVLKHPERTPALGFYSQENPEVADWETKWAVEHGVDYFIYCWYRASQGEPVKMNFSSAIHDAFFKSKFVDKMKFTIMWENQSRGRAGVADEKDLMENLLPFWIENYFKHPSYLKIDNKPLLFIYRPEFLVDDLGGEDKVAIALDKMREACKAAGFDGLYILGEYRGQDPQPLELMKRLGLDYTFAYCWYVPDSPTPEVAIETQLGYIRKTQELGILPQVATVSQAWSGWHDEGTIWKIPPTQFETLLREAKNIISTFPKDQLGSKTIILDNWNEWSEGHYIAPYREYGFGYLDAVRKVFSDAPEAHVDLLPEDIGMGPYDTAYEAYAQEQEELRKRVSMKADKAGADEPGLLAWWAFDEALDESVTLEYSGKRLGGVVHGATRAQGIDGNALVCDGGTVEVPAQEHLSPANALSIECWVKTDLAGQANTWVVNRVFGGATTAGYRLGVVDGKPCFQVPLTDWSHHLKADIDLPTGAWVHLAGTFDGSTMRIYVNGIERGSMERVGPIGVSSHNICLGNYAVGHESHFTGLLDEVKIYNRAITAEEILTRFNLQGNAAIGPTR
jgi:hypothetical protein